MEINHLLLSSPDPPIRRIIVSPAVVNSSTNIEHIKLPFPEERCFGLIALVNMVIHIAELDGHFCLKFEGQSEINDHAGPS